MTFSLYGFQTTAVEEALVEIREAQAAFVRRGKKTAVVLTACTGAGKTVIAAEILERLLLGDAEAGPNPDLAVLWVTDDPALNRQTRHKMLTAANGLIDSHFVELDSGYDAYRLEGGRIHFVNIQRLGMGASQTVRQRDGQREYGLWETIANTVNELGSNFLLIIDEAHRGTDHKSDATIVSRLTSGTDRGTVNPVTGAPHPPAPVVLGITATNTRFMESMTRAARSIEPVEVPVDSVRASGLLKDTIAVEHPDEDQASENTLLGLAVRGLAASTEAWRSLYDRADLADAEQASARLVVPLLVIQVPNAIKSSEVVLLLDTIAGFDPALVGSAVAHAFGEPVDLPAPRVLRRIAPDEIQDTPEIRVVLFKNALITGWDCPRAEVMLSLRGSNEFTAIAQLIGRMVRTPLARRIENDPGLNRVTLWLPKYDRPQVAKVLLALSPPRDDDDDEAGPEVSLNLRDFPRRPDAPKACFDLLAALPSARRVGNRRVTATARYTELVDLLLRYEIDTTGSKGAESRLVNRVRAEVANHSATVNSLLTDVMTLDMTTTIYDNRAAVLLEPGDGQGAGEAFIVDSDTRDVRALFDKATRALPGSVGKAYWRALADQSGPEKLDPEDAQARVAALGRSSALVKTINAAVEAEAREQIATLRQRYLSAVRRLANHAKEAIEEIWSVSEGSVEVEVEVPVIVSAATEQLMGNGPAATTGPVPTRNKHLYAAGPEGLGLVGEGLFPVKLTSWEADVLSAEEQTGTYVGWYRNPPRSRAALAVPYAPGDGKSVAMLYPDFVIFHAPDGPDGEIVADIVDPHMHTSADTGPKWAGLARWADANGGSGKPVRRVVAVIKTGSGTNTILRALDLAGASPELVAGLEACSTKDAIEALFAGHGQNY